MRDVRILGRMDAGWVDLEAGKQGKAGIQLGILWKKKEKMGLILNP